MGAEETTEEDSRRQDVDFSEDVSGFKGKAGSPSGQARVWESREPERDEATGLHCAQSRSRSTRGP